MGVGVATSRLQGSGKLDLGMHRWGIRLNEARSKHDALAQSGLNTVRGVRVERRAVTFEILLTR